MLQDSGEGVWIVIMLPFCFNHQLFGEVWPSYDDDDMDPESRATIERMLKEEEYPL